MKSLSKAERDAASVYLGNLNTVEFDLMLPVTGALGSKITWKSSDPRYLTAAGKVHRPPFGTGARDILLEAMFDDGAQVCSRSWTVHILEAKNDIRIRTVIAPEQAYVCGTLVCLPSALPVETEEGDVRMQDVIWDAGALRTYKEVGPLCETGHIAGTEVPVRLQIQVIQPQETAPVSAPVLQAVPLSDVRLSEGTPFYEAAACMQTYLLSQDVDRLLYSFRTAAGLDTCGASPMIGWDSPQCLLRGHTTGHYLSAIALAYASTGDVRLRDRAVYLVQALAECQDAFSGKEGFHAGFLSAYSEEQFDLLEQMVRYPKIWAPYYTLHKILSGLLDAYEWVDLPLALEVAKRLGLWTFDRLIRLAPDQRKRMWSLYIAGEYGGMNEALARLYLLTRDERYLTAARLFDNDKLLIPLHAGIDALSGMHANQHIPQMIGADKLYEATGETCYETAAKRFWQAAVEHHAYAIGGVGEGEMFRRADWIYRSVGEKTAESCASYNMLKLTMALYLRQAEPLYMEYYERTLFNHILAAGEKSASGRTTYFMPLRGGFRKTFEDENSCCHGTGMESPFLFGVMIYSRTGDTVRVEQWIDSTLQPEGLEICTEWMEDRLRLHVRFTKEFRKTLLVRVPDAPYQIFHGPFSAGESIIAERSLAVSFEPAPDDMDLGVLKYGPYILAALSDETEPVCIPLEKLQKEKGCLVWSDGRYTLIPLAEVTDAPYHVYMRVKGA